MRIKVELTFILSYFFLKCKGKIFKFGLSQIERGWVLFLLVMEKFLFYRHLFDLTFLTKLKVTLGLEFVVRGCWLCRLKSTWMITCKNWTFLCLRLLVSKILFFILKGILRSEVLFYGVRRVFVHLFVFRIVAICIFAKLFLDSIHLFALVHLFYRLGRFFV